MFKAITLHAEPVQKAEKIALMAPESTRDVSLARGIGKAD
jgi:hypothetical protein